jgi:hypothetical protein
MIRAIPFAFRSTNSRAASDKALKLTACPQSSIQGCVGQAVSLAPALGICQIFGLVITDEQSEQTSESLQTVGFVGALIFSLYPVPMLRTMNHQSRARPTNAGAGSVWW